MGQNNLAFSLIFKIIDGASAKIREISQLMAEPKAAAEALGDATEKSGDRQVSAFRKVKDALGDATQAMMAPIARMSALGRAAGEAAQKFSTSFAGIGAIVSEGFSLKNVAQQEEFFRRLQINTGMAKSAIEELREAISAASENYGVGKSKMVDAFQAYRANGGDIETFRKNADTVAAALQLTGMDAEHAGQLFATMQNKMHITKSEEFLSTLSQMRQQLKGIPEGMDAAAEASGRLAASMESLHMQGAQGMLALNAVYAVAARSTGNARQARSSTDSWINQLADRGYQNQLAQGLGERVTDANGYVMDPRIIMQKMAAKYAWAQSLPKNQQVVAEQRLNSLFGEDASKMFRSVGGEIKATGHSKTIDQVLGAQGNSAEFLGKAQEASQGLSGAMERLRNAMDGASESLFTGPVNLLSSALNHCNGVVADVVIALASLVAIGTAITWIANAISGLQLLATVLGIYKTATEEATAASEAQAAASSGSWISGLVTGIKAISVATWEWTVALLANPMTWIVLGIIAAIAAVGAGIYWLSTHWKKSWGEMPAPVKFLGEVIGNMWEGGKHLAGEFFDYCANKLKWVSDTFGQFADWVERKVGMNPGKSGDSEAASPSSAADGSPPAATGGSRGHNVGNLRNVNGHGFQTFASDSDGAAAMAHQLLLYANRDHLHTIAQIVSKYAPRNENNTAAYIRDVVRRTGVSAFTSINLNDKNTLASLMGAMIHHEQGHDVLGMDQLASIAGQGRPAGSPAAAGTALAANGRQATSFDYGNVARSSIYGAGGGAAPFSGAIPAPIYGPVTASNDPAPSSASSPIGSSSGSAEARAHLTIEIKDGKGRTKTHLDHSANMEAHLDRGPAMTMAWG